MILILGIDNLGIEPWPWQTQGKSGRGELTSEYSVTWVRVRVKVRVGVRVRVPVRVRVRVRVRVGVRAGLGLGFRLGFRLGLGLGLGHSSENRLPGKSTSL